MTIKQVIDFIDDIKPNAYTNAQKTRWIAEVEGKIQSEIFLFAPAQIITYSYPEDETSQLLVAPPHNNLYPSYLCAMIDYANGEYERYNNALTMFNQQYTEFMRWFALHYRPADDAEITAGCNAE